MWPRAHSPWQAPRSPWHSPPARRPREFAGRAGCNGRLGGKSQTAGPLGGQSVRWSGRPVCCARRCRRTVVARGPGGSSARDRRAAPDQPRKRQAELRVHSDPGPQWLPLGDERPASRSSECHRTGQRARGKRPSVRLAFLEHEREREHAPIVARNASGLVHSVHKPRGCLVSRSDVTPLEPGNRHGSPSPATALGTPWRFKSSHPHMHDRPLRRPKESK